jgi:hypothetical protein
MKYMIPHHIYMCKNIILFSLVFKIFFGSHEQGYIYMSLMTKLD